MAQTALVDIIVSDNGSSDGTAAYLEAIDTPANLRRFRHRLTMPVQRHSAFIVSQVRTEWVVFLSDDDYLEPEFSENIMRLIEENPDVSIIYTGCRLYFSDVAVSANVGPRFESASEFMYGFMDGLRNICLCATAFRARDIRTVGPQPDSCIIGDMYYWTRIATAEKVIGCAAEPLSNYSFYNPGKRNETSSASVLKWAQESQDLALEMVAIIRASRTLTWKERDLERVRTKFLALTVSNQFVWNALRGAGRLELLRSFFLLWRTLSGDINAPARAIAAVVVPRVLLERLLLAYARRRALRSTC